MDIHEKTKLLADNLPELLEAHSAKTERTMQKEDYEKLLISSVKDLHYLIGKIESLKTSFWAPESDAYYKQIRSFLARYEQSFLRAKNLICYNRFLNDALPQIDPLNLKGEGMDFQSKLQALPNGGYLYTLPPMQNKRTLEKSKYEASLLQHTMLLLHKNFEEENGRLTPLDNPVVIFVHHIDLTLGKVFIPDADNLDVKTAIDSLQNYLIKNDTLRDISQMQFGMDDNTVFTELYVLPGSHLIDWLSEHENLWKKV